MPSFLEKLIGPNPKDPYTRDNSSGWQKFLQAGSISPLHSFAGIRKMAASSSDEDARLRSAIEAQMSPEELAVWNTLSSPEKDAILNNEAYWTDTENGLHNLWGLYGGSSTFDKDLLLDDIGQVTTLGPYPEESAYTDVDSLWAQAQADVDAENESLLQILADNRDSTISTLADARDSTLEALAAESADAKDFYSSSLDSLNKSYSSARDNILASQYQRNAGVLGALASDMASARRNAIEAGASAGIRIAGNVNAILSAQNKMSQQSLETSNQLAQMLLNQQNAAAGIQGQWRNSEATRTAARRDAENTYTSGVLSANTGYNQGLLDIKSNTYDRTSSRYGDYTTKGQAKYDQAVRNWNTKFDSSYSADNPLYNYFKKYHGAKA